MGLGLLAAAEVLLFLGVEPVKGYFFLFAWWPYLLLADALCEKQGARRWWIGEGRGDPEDFWRKVRCFALLCGFSIFWWSAFEAANFRLNNWEYRNIEPRLLLRWAGYALSYATVLPGIFLTAGWLSGLCRRSEGRGSEESRLEDKRKWAPWFWVAGAFCLLTPLLWPRYFFPWIWGAGFFLGENLCRRIGAPSVYTISDFRRRLWILLAAGLVCGLLWEFWNFWAGGKWVYTVPYVGGLKIFEMPLLGYLGFPAFAVSCDSVWRLASGLWRRLGRAARIGAGLALAGLCLWVFRGIDRWTVVAWAAPPVFFP